ncbi:MAG: heme biosynthesis HemY N-terminal domain-containing protein [Oleiphilaceae bacterium]|nr:heme biosynthesis HemY N-terminal domain-containing protein [Oleiphilaceae bacterium]
MKRLFLLIIIALALALGLTYALSMDPGYVRISVGHWLVETNLLVMGVLNILFLLLLHLSFGILRRTFRVRRTVGSWLGESNARRAHNLTQQGLLAYLEGNWTDARRLLVKAANRGDTPLVNYLAAAHAASEQGMNKEAEALLKKAYESGEQSEFAVGLAQAQIQLESQQLEPCLATLLRLKKQKPNHPLVLRLLRSVYLKLEDWQHLIEILPALKQLPKAEKDDLSRLETTAWKGLLQRRLEELQREHKLDKAADELAELWKEMPDSARYEESLIDQYATYLSHAKRDQEAETLLRKMLKKQWSDSLVWRYGLVEGKSPSEQLITAENWLKEKPNNAVLLLTLGRLALRNELWGKAMEYFEASYKLQPTQESLGELYRLHRHISEDRQQATRYGEALIQSLKLPELPMPR